MKIEEGFFVVDPMGVVGLSGDREGELIEVQYRNSGPVQLWHGDSLRYATEDEVEAAGLKGVGGQIK